MVLRTWTHQGILGATQKGKTKFAERQLKDTPLMAVFVDSKGDARRGKLAGARAVRCGGRDVLEYALTHGKVIWEIPERNRMEEFRVFAQRSLRLADRVGRPFYDMFVDEIQQFSAATATVRGDSYADAIVEKLASEALGLGIRVRGMTQRPVGFHPTFRDNCNSWIVYQLSDEAMSGVKWPFASWRGHIAKPYHFVHYDGHRTDFHEPVKRVS